ncbi:MAG: hypothetical protein WKF87_19610 [Chryseolinea sp.]
MKATFLVLCSLLTLPTLGQKAIKVFSVHREVVFATVDRPGDLYLVMGDGQIQKFDVDGNLLSEYKVSPAPALFDARDGARLFAYFRKEQHYAYLSPSFEITARHAVDPSFAVKPWLVCASGDHNIWILDEVDNSIKRINNTTSGVEVEITLPDGSDNSRLTYMREYQGFLFLLDLDKGIRVFSSMGKPLMTLGYPGLTSFNFFGEELYFAEGNNLKLFNLFTAEKRDIPIARSGDIILMTDIRLFSIQGSKVEITKLSP